MSPVCTDSLALPNVVFSDGRLRPSAATQGWTSRVQKSVVLKTFSWGSYNQWPRGVIHSVMIRTSVATYAKGISKSSQITSRTQARTRVASALVVAVCVETLDLV